MNYRDAEEGKIVKDQNVVSYLFFSVPLCLCSERF